MHSCFPLEVAWEKAFIWKHRRVNRISPWEKPVEMGWWNRPIKGEDQGLCDHLRLSFLSPTANYWHHLNPKDMFSYSESPWLKEMPRDMKVAQTSRNKKLSSWLCEHQPGGNVAVPVCTDLILILMLLASYSSIPDFLTTSAGMPR